MGRAIGAQLAELKKQKETVAGMSAEKVAQVRRELDVQPATHELQNENEWRGSEKWDSCRREMGFVKANSAHWEQLCAALV